MLNWNSQRALNNSFFLQPERHMPLTFKTKQKGSTVHKKELQASRHNHNICPCTPVCQNTADSKKEGKNKSKWASFWALRAAQRRKRRTWAVLCCSSAQSISAYWQAGAAASRVRDGSRGQLWVPWFSGIIRSQAGRLMGLLTAICNPAKNSPLCLGSAGMQQPSRARDGRALILSHPILHILKQQEESTAEIREGGKKPNRESNTAEFHLVMISFYLITTDTPLFSLIYLLFHSRSQQINN